MKERVNILIAGENGGVHTFVFSRKKLLLTAVFSTLAITLAAFFGLFSVSLSLHDTYLVHRMATIQKEMEETRKINAGFEARLARIAEENTYEVALLKTKNEQLLTNLQLKSSHMIADLKMQNQKQEAAFKEEKQKILSAVVSELQERTDMIANVMSHIGVKLKKPKQTDMTKNSGGPFIALEDSHFNRLISTADHYLATLRSLPLGKPVSGEMGSPYGPRMDPITHTAAFHSGIDIHGNIGDAVHTTAEGEVTFAGENSGGYGRFVEIDHDNQYSTGYGHLLRYVVKEGDHVTRGQIIGYIGNTGRSTGPHLHYEISVDGKTIDPNKYLNIADISRYFVARKGQ